MHVIFRESHGLEETAAPTDLGQSPADLVVLSFSDSDLGAFAAGWHQARRDNCALPDLRLANLAALRHPLSVDTYLDATLTHARGILVRLIGGVPYWDYGIEQLSAMARQKGIALAVLPADGRPDPRLDAASTVPASTLHQLARLCDAGGAGAARAALAQLALAAGLYAPPQRGQRAMADVGGWCAGVGPACPAAFAVAPSGRPRMVLVFYRAYLAAEDLDPITSLAQAFEAMGYDVLGLFAPSLKAPNAARWMARWVAYLGPQAIVNATAFSARGSGPDTPLDAADCAVFQIALATNDHAAWDTTARGLSPADLAMHVVLPEVDGRIFAGVASFKSFAPRDTQLQFSRAQHAAHAPRIAAIAARIDRWVRLRSIAPQNRRIALILSSYPGKTWQMAHAVGLDALASAQAIMADMGVTPPPEGLATALGQHSVTWPLDQYRAALADLPVALQQALDLAWGAPENDPCVRDGLFHFPAVVCANVLIALQPERADTATRVDDYHDLARTPRHGYVAFYLWLARRGTDALIHLGAHGTLEWLPGKSVALSDTCWPEALVGAMPVIYPFIVNDPGEAAQAKRRIGAITLGHAPPPLRKSETGAGLSRLETLLDEFSNADGLDPARRTRLMSDITSEAEGLGLSAEIGLSRDLCQAEAITRIDRFVCDVKDSQFGDGLHIWARSGPSAGSEAAGLEAALSGRRVAPGPSGSPNRGRTDVLPTGRNLYTIDPRAVPTPSAHAQGIRLADEVIRRHLQEEGDWPRGLVVDLWGSASMRTAGEEFSMALHLLGVRPQWDEGTGRVRGIEILPLAELDRPRIDVTLRVSGLFRDVFPTLGVLFGQAVQALALRDEAADWNPFVRSAPGARVYGPAPGSFGLGMGAALEDYSDEGRASAGNAWLAASAHALDTGTAVADPDGIRARVQTADAFVHLQDLPETDLLLAVDYATHEAGFAAAKAVAGGAKAALWHLDATDPDRPRARGLSEEIARVLRARAANPAWADGMMRHGFRGAAELAATLDHMAAFAHLAGVVPGHLFDLYHDATLGRDDVRAFLARENPQALAAMQDRLRALAKAGLWQTRRNSILASLGAAV